jgi:hypothetical protein
MKVRRDVTAVPVRSARETWSTIIDLISGKGTVDSGQLLAAASVMETVIAEEQPRSSPIVVSGCGDRLVIYCVYGEAALEAGTAIDRLTWNPTGEGWKICAPASSRDVKWMNDTLGSRASRISVYDSALGVSEDASGSQKQATGAFEIDWKGLGSR